MTNTTINNRKLKSSKSSIIKKILNNNKKLVTASVNIVLKAKYCESPVLESNNHLPSSFKYPDEATKQVLKNWRDIKKEKEKEKVHYLPPLVDDIAKKADGILVMRQKQREAARLKLDQIKNTAGSHDMTVISVIPPELFSIICEDAYGIVFPRSCIYILQKTFIRSHKERHRIKKPERKERSSSPSSSS
ncbi:hypothetical protein RIF29_17946 [Crotalaria pallida]|uniref:Uncharacterized protein n=1 Tax=Crotalaria pallida TaxID=3830 RepID=A0AAN9FJ12_CROPI